MIEFAEVTIIIQLVFLKGVLSLDNAAVLGARVAHLPTDKPPPWPGVLYPLLSKLNSLSDRSVSQPSKPGCWVANSSDDEKDLTITSRSFNVHLVRSYYIGPKKKKLSR